MARSVKDHVYNGKHSPCSDGRAMWNPSIQLWQRVFMNDCCRCSTAVFKPKKQMSACSTQGLNFHKLYTKQPIADCVQFIIDKCGVLCQGNDLAAVLGLCHPGALSSHC